MKFGPVPVADAQDAILAHSVFADGRRLRKGRRLSAEDIASLRAAGVTQVTVARLDPDDIPEDAAAAQIAAAVLAPGLSQTAAFTGRANIHAERPGILRVDTRRVAAANNVSEAITLATLPDCSRVAPRQMVATAKIIPYAVPADQLAKAEAALAAPALHFHPFRPLSVSLILTETPGLKPRLLEKARDSVATRLAALGLDLGSTRTVAHDTAAVAGALGAATGDLILIFGASATSDRGDVCPAAVVAAGGVIDRFGMPVDPGNLLFLGRLGAQNVIGLPGCARSPALNGADWVLERLVAGIPIADADFAAMGAGGLLKEIPTRPQPRQGNAQAPLRPVVEILLLAGGASRRMGGVDKLLKDVGDGPLLRHGAKAACGAGADRVLVAIPAGHRARREAVAGLELDVIEAPDTTGMAATLAHGITALSPDADAVIIALADMPDITSHHYDQVMAAFDPGEGRTIIRATAEDGMPGHPVLFGRRFFESLAALTGDSGARSVIAAGAEYLIDLPLKGVAAVTDLDTPEAWREWQNNQKQNRA